MDGDGESSNALNIRLGTLYNIKNIGTNLCTDIMTKTCRYCRPDIYARPTSKPQVHRAYILRSR